MLGWAQDTFKIQLSQLCHFSTFHFLQSASTRPGFAGLRYARLGYTELTEIIIEITEKDKKAEKAEIAERAKHGCPTTVIRP
jgi:hypothetical protein